MAKHYRRADGSFAGTWVDGAPADPTLIEVATAPSDGRMTYDGSTWVAPPAIVPATITPLQARKALRAAGLYNAVQNYVASLPEEAREEWEYATQIERNNTIIAGGAAALGMSSEQVDQLFIMGAGL